MGNRYVVVMGGFILSMAGIRAGLAQSCVGCNQEPSTPPDTSMRTTARIPGHPDDTLLCMVDIRMLVGGYFQSCTGLSAQCSSGECRLAYSVEAKTNDLVANGCTDVFFDLEERLQRGGFTSEWNNITPGAWHAQSYLGTTWTEVYAGYVAAGCGAGESLAELQFAPGLLPPVAEWVGPGTTTQTGVQLSDDQDMSISVKCSRCRAPWEEGGGGD